MGIVKGIKKNFLTIIYSAGAASVFGKYTHDLFDVIQDVVKEGTSLSWPGKGWSVFPWPIKGGYGAEVVDELVGIQKFIYNYPYIMPIALAAALSLLGVGVYKLEKRVKRGYGKG